MGRESQSQLGRRLLLLRSKWGLVQVRTIYFVVFPFHKVYFQSYGTVCSVPSMVSWKMSPTEAVRHADHERRHGVHVPLQDLQLWRRVPLSAVQDLILDWSRPLDRVQPDVKVEETVPLLGLWNHALCRGDMESVSAKAGMVGYDSKSKTRKSNFHLIFFLKNRPVFNLTFSGLESSTSESGSILQKWKEVGSPKVLAPASAKDLAQVRICCWWTL